MLDENKFKLDTYIIQQQSIANTGKYCIKNDNLDDILFATSPIFQIKFKVDIYDSENKNQKCFTVKQDRLLALNLSYTVKDNNGVTIGYIKRKYTVINDVWEIRDAQNIPIGRAKEQIQTTVIDVFTKTRKFANFDIFLGEQKIGELIRQFTIKDKYILNLRGDLEKKLDRRIGIALAIALDVGLDR